MQGLDLLQVIILVFDKLKLLIEKTFPSDDQIIKPSSLRRSNIQKLIYIFRKNLHILLIFVLIILASFRFWFVFDFYNKNIVREFIHDYNQKFDFIKSSLAILVFSFAFVNLIVWFNKINRKNHQQIIFLLILILICGISPLNIIERKIWEINSYIHLHQANSNILEEEYKDALNIFGMLSQEINMLDDRNFDKELNKLIASANFQARNFEECVKGYAELVFFGNYYENSPEVFMLHSSIYALGKSVGMDQAISVIEDLHDLYPKKEISPIWLALSPENNIYLLLDYVREVEVEPEDYTNLKKLTLLFPDDYYADFALIALGESKKVADRKPLSEFRDWALYRTGRDEYFDYQLEEGKKYFELFLSEFPNHRWSGDAIYRIARIYELQGEHDIAFSFLMEYWNKPGQPSNYWIEQMSVAMIDVYFNSGQIVDLLNRYISDDYKSIREMLTYSLAEQYLKESNVLKAYEIFTSFVEEFPDSYYFAYAKDAVKRLENLLEIKEENPLSWPLEWAKISMYPYDYYDYLDYVSVDDISNNIFIYNEFYLGARVKSLSLIGINGPGWDYYQMANNYLWSINLLETECKKCPHMDEVLYIELLGYYNLTYSGAFIPKCGSTAGLYGPDLPDDISIKNKCNRDFVFERLEKIGTDMLSQYPGSQYTVEALSIIGIAFDNRGDYKKAIEWMTLILEHYPDHSLANNASIYIARLNRKAGDISDNLSIREMYYRKSVDAYEFTIINYPGGHVEREAKMEYLDLKHLIDS